jgi:Rad3-related DNA helicase
VRAKLRLCARILDKEKGNTRCVFAALREILMYGEGKNTLRLPLQTTHHLAGSSPSCDLSANFRQGEGKYTLRLCGVARETFVEGIDLPVPQQRFLLVLEIIPTDHTALHQLTEIGDPVKDRRIVIAF